jgi:Domain of Unknown Function (DUF1080)
MLCVSTHGQDFPRLASIADATAWHLQNRNATVLEEADRKYVHLDAQKDAGIAWLDSCSFFSGTIEVDLRGSDVQGKSFVGMAFHGTNSETYEAVYFRPFNFRSADPVRRTHSVQYIAEPAYPWEKLRSAFPGKYERALVPAPDPNQWFHVRIVVDEKTVRVFVNGEMTLSLEVTALNEHRTGAIGLWVGNGSSGDFANFSIAPRK